MEIYSLKTLYIFFTTSFSLASFLSSLSIISSQSHWSTYIECILSNSQYKSSLGVIQTQQAIKDLKDYFEQRLSEELKLTREGYTSAVPPWLT